MISERLEQAMNEQISKEWWSAGIYKAMEAYCASEDLQGFATWFRVQALEELTHGERFFQYITAVGGRAKVLAIPEPKNTYASPLDAATYGLDHERQVTAMINRLVAIAREENDNAAQILLQWFVAEQVEEEANFTSLVKKLKMVEGDGRGVLLLDQELGTRVFTPPVSMMFPPPSSAA
jgi:ferritin